MNKQLAGMSLAALGIFLISFESLIIKLAHVDMYTFSFYVGIAMFLSCNAFILWKAKGKWSLVTKTYSDYKVAMLIAALLSGSSNFLFIAAIKTTTVANTVFIFSTAPILAAVAAWLVLRAKTPLRIFYAAAVIFVGLSIMLSDSESGGGSLLGDVYAFGAVLGFSCLYVLFTKYPDINRITCVASGAFCAATLAYYLGSGLETLDQNSIYAILIMGVLIAPTARVLLGNSTRYITPAEAGLFTIGETILAPIWVWLVFSEAPSQIALIGGAIILLALIGNAYLGLKESKQVLAS